MVLEAVMICLDNSEYMRNGDYSPTRLKAMNETVNSIINAKINDNAETTCGLLSMAGERIETHSSPCRSLSSLMSATTTLNVGGNSNFEGGLKVAKLALKNRPNKNQKQRIIVFVGSPVEIPEKKMVQLGKKFKKDNVAVDVINFGTENSTNENVEILEKFIGAVNSNENSHLVNIPPGPHVLSDLVLSSIMQEPGAAASSGGGGGGGGAAGGGFDVDSGGVDPSMDPELAMALRMSIEEERQRQEKANKANTEGASADASSGEATGTPVAMSDDAAEVALTTADAAMDDDDDDDDEDEEAMLAQAIAMSIAATVDDNDAPKEETKTEDSSGDPGDSEMLDALSDPNFISSLLEQVPGINADDVALDDILSNLTGGEEDKKEDKKEGN